MWCPRGLLPALLLTRPWPWRAALGALGPGSLHWALQPHQHPPHGAEVSSASSRWRGLEGRTKYSVFQRKDQTGWEVTLFLQFHLLQLGHGGGAGGLPIILIRGAPRAAKLQPRAGSSPGSCWLLMNTVMAAQPGLAPRCSGALLRTWGLGLHRNPPGSEAGWVLLQWDSLGAWPMLPSAEQELKPSIQSRRAPAPSLQVLLCWGVPQPLLRAGGGWIPQ